VYTIDEVIMQILKDSVREEILTAAAKQFRTYGYAQASLRHIATEAKISVGNVYRYFDNKDTLFEAVIHDPIIKLQSILALEANDYDHPQQAFAMLVEGFSQTLFSLIQDNKDALFVMLNHPKTARQIQDQLHAFLNRLALRYADPADIESKDKILLIKMLSSGIFHGVYHAIEMSQEVSEENLRLAITQYFQLHAYMTYAIKENIYE
jgi:AcrR family transcriptional regulator